MQNQCSALFRIPWTEYLLIILRIRSPAGETLLVIDPLSNDPLVVSGSANFSRPSQRTNDENMLIIRGNTRVADIYFGEFMRIFDHHYARYVVRVLQNQDKSDPSAGYLKETAEEWIPSHFNGKSYKAKRRRYFVMAE